MVNRYKDFKVPEDDTRYIKNILARSLSLSYTLRGDEDLRSSETPTGIGNGKRTLRYSKEEENRCILFSSLLVRDRTVLQL